MNSDKKIRVLVVDDSLVFREALARGLGADPNIQVVATASDPFDARDKIINFLPDVVTLDIEMPKMNGIEFLNRLMPQYPLPIIVISSMSNIVFEALNAGAVDFVAKPAMTTPNSIKDFFNELIFKIKVASTANLSNWKKDNLDTKVNHHINASTKEVIAIGASTGGTEAIYNILQRLPKNLPGIVIVQHMPPVFTRMFAERINQFTPFEAKEACHGDTIQPGHVLVAPGDYQMRVKKIGDVYKVQCFEGEKVSGHCPSVDVLFDSVANEYGKKAIGVILTGMGADGAKGLLAMKLKGAKTIGQDKASCIVYGMPRVAYEMGAVEIQGSLEKIPQQIISLL